MLPRDFLHYSRERTSVGTKGNLAAMLEPATRDALRRVVVFGNDKGGVLKTSCVANIGGLLAAADYRVLLVDADPQGNLGEDLGYTNKGDDGASLSAALIEGVPPTPLKSVRPNLDVLVGGERTYDAESHLAQLDRDGESESARSSLANALASIANQYDIILIDSPPKIRLLQEVALTAGRWLVIPTRTDDSSRKGLQVMGARFQNARVINPSLELLGVVLVGVGSRSVRIQDQARAAIGDDFGDAGTVFAGTVRYVEAAAVDARRRGELAHELEVAVATEAADRPWWEALRTQKTPGPRLAASAGSLAGDYQHVAEEILERLSQGEAAAAAEAGGR